MPSMTTRRRARRAALTASLGLIALAVASAPADAHDGHETATSGPYGSTVRGLPAGALPPLMRLKSDLAALRTPERAIAAGYLPSTECAQSPAGGMGYHYVNPSLFGPVDVARPPVLVFVPGPSGLTLGAAEWMVPDADQDLATDSDRPNLLGIPFDGPMPGHEPGMPVHYDLHVWLGTHNPDGLLAPFNPTVHC